MSPDYVIKMPKCIYEPMMLSTGIHIFRFAEDPENLYIQAYLRSGDEILCRIIFDDSAPEEPQLTRIALKPKYGNGLMITLLTCDGRDPDTLVSTIYKLFYDISGDETDLFCEDRYAPTQYDADGFMRLILASTYARRFTITVNGINKDDECGDAIVHMIYMWARNANVKYSDYVGSRYSPRTTAILMDRSMSQLNLIMAELGYNGSAAITVVEELCYVFRYDDGGMMDRPNMYQSKPRHKVDSRLRKGPIFEDYPFED